MAIGAGELLNLMNVHGMGTASMHVADVDYGVPTKEYVTEDFPKWWENELRSRIDRMSGGEIAEIEWKIDFDCDNFAWTFFVDIQMAHHVAKRSAAEGLSVGVCYYMAGARAEGGGGGGHAINIAVCGGKGAREIVFIEPQYAAKGQPCILTPSVGEISSVWFINF